MTRSTSVWLMAENRKWYQTRDLGAFRFFSFHMWNSVLTRIKCNQATKFISSQKWATPQFRHHTCFKICNIGFFHFIRNFWPPISSWVFPYVSMLQWLRFRLSVSDTPQTEKWRFYKRLVTRCNGSVWPPMSCSAAILLCFCTYALLNGLHTCRIGSFT